MSSTLSNHYTSGLIAARPVGGIEVPLPATEEPMVPVLPLPWDNDFCPYCFERLPVPWLVLPCLDDACLEVDTVGANVALDDRLVLDEQPTFAPAHFDTLLTGTELGGARWAAAPEPASLVGERALRLVAFDGSTGAPLRMLSASGGVIDAFRKGPNAPFGVTPVPASALRPSPRTGFAVAVSGGQASAWIAGGTAAGEVLGEVWRFGALSNSWERVPMSGVSTGRIHAIAYGPLDGRLYLLDEITERRRVRMRLLSVPAAGGPVVVEDGWPRLAPTGHALLATGSDGSVWVAGGIGGMHAVARLRRDRRGVLRPAGFRVGRGELTGGGAFAAPAGLSLAVLDRRGVPRILGYGVQALSPRGGPEGCF